MGSLYHLDKEWMRPYVDRALQSMGITPRFEAHLEYTSLPGGSTFAPMLLYVDDRAVIDGNDYAIFTEWGEKVARP